MIDFCLLGTSGMTPLPNRHLSSAVLRYSGTNFLIDCGEGTQVALKKNKIQLKSIRVICLTHYHADHTTGLPGLLASLANAEKTDALTIVGPGGLLKVVNAALALAPKLPYRVKCIELTEKQAKLNLFGLEITAFSVEHGVPCFGYSFVLPRPGKCDVEKAKRNEVPEEIWTDLQHDKIVVRDGRVFTKDLIMGKPRKGIKLTYVTDTRPCNSIILNAKNSDLFICEGMYGSDDSKANALKNNHMTFQEAAILAKDSFVKEVWLTHYSPGVTRPQNFIRNASYIFNNVKTGRDGMNKTLTFEET